MADLKLDENHDLAIEDDNLVLVNGIEAIAQNVSIRLQFFLGEWFLDVRLGVPYYQKILGEKPRLPVLKNIFNKVILGTPGILEVNDLTITFESVSRRLDVSFQASTTEGPLDYSQEFII